MLTEYTRNQTIPVAQLLASSMADSFLTSVASFDFSMQGTEETAEAPERQLLLAKLLVVKWKLLLTEEEQLLLLLASKQPRAVIVLQLLTARQPLFKATQLLLDGTQLLFGGGEAAPLSASKDTISGRFTEDSRKNSSNVSAAKLNA